MFILIEAEDRNLFQRAKNIHPEQNLCIVEYTPIPIMR